MADSDSNIASVASSYSDVNTALENLLGNMSAENNFISSTFGKGANDLAGAGLFYQVSSNEPVFSYKDASGNTKLVPLGGASTINNSNNMATSTIPVSLLNIGGNMYMQAFNGALARGNTTGTITFPVAFRSGTTPFVSASSVEEPEDWNQGNGYGSIPCIRQNDDGSLQVTNTGFNILRLDGIGQRSTNSISIPTIAIGLM